MRNWYYHDLKYFKKITIGYFKKQIQQPKGVVLILASTISSSYLVNESYFIKLSRYQCFNAAIITSSLTVFYHKLKIFFRYSNLKTFTILSDLDKHIAFRYKQLF